VWAIWNGQHTHDIGGHNAEIRGYLYPLWLRLYNKNQEYELWKITPVNFTMGDNWGSCEEYGIWNQFGSNPESPGIVWEGTFGRNNESDFRVHNEKELPFGGIGEIPAGEHWKEIFDSYIYA